MPQDPGWINIDPPKQTPLQDMAFGEGPPTEQPTRRPPELPAFLTIIGVQFALDEPHTFTIGDSLRLDMRYVYGAPMDRPTYLVADDGSRWRVCDNGTLQQLNQPMVSALEVQRLKAQHEAELHAHDMEILKDSLDLTGDKLNEL